MRVMQIIGSRGGGGAEGFFVRLTNALHDSGGQLLAVTLPESQVSKGLKPEVPQQHIAMRGVWDIFARWKIARAIGEFRPHVVQTWMGRATRLVSLGRGRLPVHIARLGGYYKLHNYRHVHAWIGNTAGICDYLRANGFPRERVFHIGNFVEPAAVADQACTSATRQRFSIPEDALLIASAGRLHSVKGFSDLLQAFSVLPPAIAGRPLHLLIAGDGELASSLHDQAASLGISGRVCWAGWQQDIGPLLDMSDVFACPSRQETLGNIILEAWAHGKPVVSTATRGALEIMTHEQDGLIVPCAQPESLASALRDILTYDAKTLSVIGEAGRSTLLREHGKEHVIEQYLDLYRQLVREVEGDA
ncbi:MAG: glycosyltransferase [Dechloromonas sp.]|nr:MAG: glycosyltransferase [Dechloromonas sp.]